MNKFMNVGDQPVVVSCETFPVYKTFFMEDNEGLPFKHLLFLLYPTVWVSSFEYYKFISLTAHLPVFENMVFFEFRPVNFTICSFKVSPIFFRKTTNILCQTRFDHFSFFLFEKEIIEGRADLKIVNIFRACVLSIADIWLFFVC